MRWLRAARLVRAGDARDPPRDRRRRHRRRHPRQEPPPRRLASCAHVRVAARWPPRRRRCVEVDARRRRRSCSGPPPAGMGLTGVVLDATLRLTPVETRRLPVDTERAARPRRRAWPAWPRATTRYRYSVAWIDLLARGPALGRSRAHPGRLRPARRAAAARAPPSPLAFDPAAAGHGAAVGAARACSTALTRPGLQRGCGSARRPRRARGRGPDDLPPSSTRSTAWRGWNRLYGPRGFVQYQFVVPVRRRGACAAHGGRAARARPARRRSWPCSSASAPADPGPLSFPMPGWTLALDIPAGVAGLGRAARRARRAGRRRRRPGLPGQGRPRSARAAAGMYPRLAEWRAVRRRVDPDGVLASRPGPAAAAVTGTCRLAPTRRHRRTTRERRPGSPSDRPAARRHSRDRPGHRPRAGRAPGCRTVVLAGRDLEALETGGRRAARRRRRAPSTCVRFDAADADAHAALVDAGLRARHGDLDLVLLAFGVLGDQDATERDPAAAARRRPPTTSAPSRVGLPLSPAAAGPGPRHARRAVVGGGGAGPPGQLRLRLAQGRARRLRPGPRRRLVGTGARVARGPARASCTRDDPRAARRPARHHPRGGRRAVVGALAADRSTVWVPRAVGPLMTALSLLPRPLWRRLPG